MTNTILLTGAGFSKNWGGWLADEVFEYLIGSRHLDETLRNLLWECKERRHGGFEDALAMLQAEHSKQETAATSQRLKTMTSAIQLMFVEMAEGFQRVPFEFHNAALSQESLVADFLKKFKAIYTLNQDSLLEHHYIKHPIVSATTACPGLTPGEFTLLIGVRSVPIFVPSQHLRLPTDHYQPYIKLHGSYNWMQGEEELLILGGGKAANIEKIPLLKWYHDLFRQDLAKPDTRLVVIGYSFNDPHINDAIMEAAHKTQLTIFIIDPMGVDILDKRSSKAQITPPKPELLEKLSPIVRGASRRRLREIFDNDYVEHAKVMRFFRN